MENLLRLGPNIDCIPSIHGRSAFAQEVRRLFLKHRYSCIAIELPSSLKSGIVEGVERLPLVSSLVYREEEGQYCYVPITPSDSIMEGVRMARAERVPLEFIDLEVPTYKPEPLSLPDEYAVSLAGLEEYYGALAPFLFLPEPDSQQDLRERYMAYRLQELTLFYDKILFVCGIGHLEGIRKYFHQKNLEALSSPVKEVKYQLYRIHPDTIYFLMGELPYLTYLYEKMRRSLDPGEFDKTDGIKELLVDARKNYVREFPEEGDLLGPGLFQTLLTYLRNLSLFNFRLTPSLYNLIVAARGVAGGRFALEVAEMAKFYPFMDSQVEWPEMFMEIDQGVLPGIGEVGLKNRLPGPPTGWKNVKIERKPPKMQKKKWKRLFNPWGQCSWPDEDEIIENFMAHVRKRALNMLSEDQKKVEKFSSSFKDGIDLRETLRNWHTGDIYVKETPPSRGEVGAVVIIFEKDSPESEKYPWCSTWQAEHQNESTISFYATDFKEDMVGPQIGRSYYGGVMFIYPPRIIEDIWVDPVFEKWKVKDEKLVVAGILYSEKKFVAYVASNPPSSQLKRFARSLDKHIIYLPLSTFSGTTVRKLRKFHVLGGKNVRSYARDYIR